jgi:hypothetical protein
VAGLISGLTTHSLDAIVLVVFRLSEGFANDKARGTRGGTEL